MNEFIVDGTRHDLCTKSWITKESVDEQKIIGIEGDILEHF